MLKWQGGDPCREAGGRQVEQAPGKEGNERRVPGPGPTQGREAKGS